MRKIISILFLTGIFAIGAYAQQVCPANMVCLTRPAAEAALKAGDERDALQKENTAIKNENSALKNQVLTLQDSFSKILAKNTDLLVDNANIRGQLTEVKVNQVRTDALMDILVKNSRKKSIGLIAF